MKRNNDDQDVLQESITPITFFLSSYRRPNSRGGTLFQFYLHNSITTSDIYADMIQDIRMASPDDDIFLYINNNGGMVDTGMQIINAMNECHGVVYTVLDGCARSVAAIIFLAGPNRIVYQDGSLMLHNFSAGVQGKGHELLQSIFGYHSYIGQFLERYSKPFLTNEEYDRVVDGKDVWFNAEEIQNRLQLMEQDVINNELETEKIMLSEQMLDIKQRLRVIDNELKAKK